MSSQAGNPASPTHSQPVNHGEAASSPRRPAPLILGGAVRRVVVVHGYAATPDAHWFPWLGEQLTMSGIAVDVVTLPRPLEPETSSWEQAVSDALGVPDERTWVVAHSLGVVTALRVLVQLDEPWQLGGLVGVAGFTGALPNLPVLDDYLAAVVEVESVVDQINHRVVMHSDADSIVAPEASIALAQRLSADIVTVEGAGHFMDSEGVTALPLLLDVMGVQNSPEHDPPVMER